MLPIDQLIQLFNLHLQRRFGAYASGPSLSEARGHKPSPLPHGRPQHNHLDEPEHQLAVCKILKSHPRRLTLDPPHPPDPPLHLRLRRLARRLQQKDHQQARVHADMEMSDGAERGDVDAVDSADFWVRGRERLHVPRGRGEGLREDLRRQEVQVWPREARGFDDDVGVHGHGRSGLAFGRVGAAVVDQQTSFCRVEDVGFEPAACAGADLLEDLIVAHGCARVEALALRGEVSQVAVEEPAQAPFRYEGEEGFISQDVHAEQHVDDGVAWDDPLFRLSGMSAIESCLGKSIECWNKSI